MSLDIYLMKNKTTEYCSFNITHNLNKMAMHVSIEGYKRMSLYKYLWYPEKVYGYRDVEADDLISPLMQALQKLHRSPKVYCKYNADNGWGTYEGFIEFLENLLLSCIKYPNARIEVSR